MVKDRGIRLARIHVIDARKFHPPYHVNNENEKIHHAVFTSYMGTHGYAHIFFLRLLFGSQNWSNSWPLIWQGKCALGVERTMTDVRVIDSMAKACGQSILGYRRV